MIKSEKFSKTFENVFFAALFGLALFYYKERMILSDPSFFSFLMIQDTWFSPVLGRWGTVLSQVIPLISLKFNVGLDAFLKLYSLSFIAVYYAIFFGLKKVYKSKIYAWAFIVFLTLAFRETFYYPTAELYIGVALAFFVPAIMALNNLYLRYGLLLLLYILSTYFHQITIFPFVFLILWGLKKNIKQNLPIAIGCVLMFAWFIIRVKLLTESQYETDKIPGISDMLKQLGNLTSLGSFKFLVGFLLKRLWWIFFLPIISFVIFVRYKKWIKAILTAIAPFGMCLFIVIFFYRGEASIMLQNYYSILGIFIGFPLLSALFLLYNKKQLNSYAVSLPIAVISFVGIVGIIQASAGYTERINYIERIGNYQSQLNKSKIILSKNNADLSFLSQTWAESFSSLYLSSLNSKNNSKTYFISDNPEQDLAKVSNNKNAFLGPSFEPIWWTSNSLKEDFFNLKNQSYSILNTAQTAMHCDSLFAKHIGIEASDVYTLKQSHWKQPAIYVTLNNTGSEILASESSRYKQVKISYHLYDANGELLSWDNVRTNLEIDLWPNTSFSQRLNLEKIEKGKDYILGIQIVEEGISWWGNEVKCKLRYI